MADLIRNCDICSSQHKLVPAKVLCLECEDLLCTDCKKYHALSKGTRQHKTMPVNDHNDLPVFLKNVQLCTKHNEKFLVFCYNDEKLGCRICVIEEHKSCENVAKLELMFGNEQMSNAFTDIENVLLNMSMDIEKLQTDRQNNLESLCCQERQIENDIDTLRLKLNNTLDIMQSKIVSDLKKRKQEEDEKIEIILKSLSIQKLEIAELQKEIASLKKYASNLQVFLAVGKLKERCREASGQILGMAEAGDFRTSTLKHQVDKYMVELNLGTIVTGISPSDIKLQTNNEIKRVLSDHVLPSFSADKLSYKNNRNIDTGCTNTRGCVLLPDGRSFLTCYDKNTLSGFDKYGAVRYIKEMQSPNVFDIAYENHMYNENIFISSKKAFHKMNLKNGNTELIKNESQNLGVVIKNNKLVYCSTDTWTRGYYSIKARQDFIYERGCYSSDKERTIVQYNFLKFSYVTVFCGRLYFTNDKDNSVSCCKMDGSQIWKYTNKALQCPLGVSVDNYANVYVIYKNPGNVVVISPNGQRHKEVLSASDGLVQPQVLHYQRLTNQLLVANKEGKAFVFDVSTT